MAYLTWERAANENKADMRNKERLRTIWEWKAKWDVATYGDWTRRLISKLERWITCGPQVLATHQIQILTGYGCFRTHLYRIG